MEPAGGPQLPSAKKLWRVLRAVYYVVLKGVSKNHLKLSAVHLHLARLLPKRSAGHLAVHPHPHPHQPVAAGYLSSLSCRSMDAAAAVYPYRPREVEFSCSSTPLHTRRRQYRRARRRDAAELTRLFELLDVKEAEAEVADNGDDDDGVGVCDMESVLPWTAAGTAPQVRITDSPFPVKEDEEGEGEGRGVVDKRADEFITWFHEQLRSQQQQPCATARARPTYYWVR